MKWILALLLTTPLLGAPASKKSVAEPNYDFRTGDIVFQATGGSQCLAVRAATNSKYSHCGVVFFQENKPFVLEAISPVTITPLKTFRERSLPGTFTARRLKSDRTQVGHQGFENAEQWARQQVGKPYDIKFLWSDSELYCSELVWKLFQQAGVTLNPLRRYDTFELSHPRVRELIKSRFGSMEAFPASEMVVAPSDLAASALLVEPPKL